MSSWSFIWWSSFAGTARINGLNGRSIVFDSSDLHHRRRIPLDMRRSLNLTPYLTLNSGYSTCDTIPVFMRIAFDTGGTFTDCVFLRGGRLEILKVPSTPRKPSDAIAHALDRILAVRRGYGRPRTRLRHDGGHERASSEKRRARHPCDDSGFRRRPGNRPASAPATLQSVVREAGAARSAGAAPWAARKAGFRWPRPASAV